MLDQFSRSELIFGKDGMTKLHNAKVAVFGVGGVGGYCLEVLARSGVGGLDLFDDDKICVTNINRQLHATHKTVGQYKVDAAKERISDINPNARVGAYKMFYLPDTSPLVNLTQYDYIIDAIDTVTGKIELVVRANEHDIPIISSMGAGNKMDAAALEISDIYATTVCPLAKVMRHELRKRGILRLKVVYSREPVIPPKEDTQTSCRTSCVCPQGTIRKCTDRRRIPGSNAFVPAAAGIILAGEVIKDLLTLSSS